jgi:low temperature requirement protein LtrA
MLDHRVGRRTQIHKSNQKSVNKLFFHFLLINTLRFKQKNFWLNIASQLLVRVGVWFTTVLLKKKERGDVLTVRMEIEVLPLQMLLLRLDHCLQMALRSL